MSATPRTDAHIKGGSWSFDVDFARQLETELNGAKALLAEATRYLAEEVNPAVEAAEIGVSKLRAKLQAAEADAKRLAEALRNPEQISHTLEAAKQKEDALAVHEARKEGK
jgi:hypothetical protein